MADLTKVLAPSGFSVDFDQFPDQVPFYSIKPPEFKPQVAGGKEPIGSMKGGKAVRQINSAGFQSLVTFEVVTISSPSPTSASVLMWKWFINCLPPSDGGKGKWKESKKTCTIMAYDHDDEPIQTWNLEEVWPSKYSLAELSVESKDYLKETWTLVCELSRRE